MKRAEEAEAMTVDTKPFQPAESIALVWLTEMQHCVRKLDYVRCRAIFADEVVAFGTRAYVVDGLHELEHDQWRQIWGAIRNFTFVIDDLRCGWLGESAVWIACPWTSEAPAADGAWSARPGRMTAILERQGGRWLSKHTHHSLAPESIGVG